MCDRAVSATKVLGKQVDFTREQGGLLRLLGRDLALWPHNWTSVASCPLVCLLSFVCISVELWQHPPASATQHWGYIMLTTTSDKRYMCGNPLCDTRTSSLGKMRMHWSKSQNGCKRYEPVQHRFRCLPRVYATQNQHISQQITWTCYTHTP
jgi:hypothetical protein